MGLEIERLIEREKASLRSASLFAIAQNLSKQLLQTWQIPPVSIADLIEQVEERALRQANVLGGSHAFVLESYNEADRVIGSEVFRVTAESLPGGTSIAHEPPNEGGAFAQMMRHNEAQARTGVLQFERFSNASIRLLEASTKHNERLEGRFSDLLARMETLVLGEYHEKIALKKVESDAELKKMMVERLGNVLPEIVGSITGKLTGTPGAAAAIKAKGAFESIRPEQLETILGCLDMEQKIALLGLMKSLAAEGEKKDPNGAPSKTH